MSTVYDHTFRRFSELFGVKRERADIPKIAKAACAEGFAVIAVYPGTKRPMCTLTPAQVKAANALAQADAEAAGKARWQEATHDCGRSHAITDPAEALKVFTRLCKNGDVNIGAEPGKSRWIAVDVDQVNDVDQWMRYWADRSEDPSLAGAAPTVSSPGVFGDTPEAWKHKGGGHIWYWLPEDVDFSTSDVHLPMPMLNGTASVYFNDALVLLPPSVRPEGEYVIQSDACQAPGWLVDELKAFIAERRARTERQAATILDIESPIDRWSWTLGWDDLLLDDGWEFSHKTDKCSCPIWSRPGADRGSYKSATAHEIGCLRYDVDEDQSPGFLHIWTDNPPDFLQDYVRSTGSKSITKFNYLAWRDHGGDNPSTMRALGIPGKNAAQELPTITAAAVAATPVSAELKVFEPAVAHENGGGAREGGQEDTDEPDPLSSTETPRLVPPAPAPVAEQLSKVWYFADEFDEIPEREMLIEGIIVRNSYMRIIGKSNHGKSFLAVDMAGHICRGLEWRGNAVVQGRVAYVAAEDSDGIIARIKAWELHHGEKLGRDFLLRVEGVQVNEGEAWRQLIADMVSWRPEMIFIDTQAASTYGLVENDNDDGSAMNKRMIELQKISGATVCLLHHKGHAGGNGRGASSVVGALDTEIAIDKDDEAVGGVTRVTISCPKQKNSAQFADMRAEIRTVSGTKSAVLLPSDAPPAGAETEIRPLETQEVQMHRVWRYIHTDGRPGGLTQSQLLAEFGWRQTRDDVANKAYPRMHKQVVRRALAKAIENNWIVDAATGAPVVDSTPEAGEILFSNRTTVLLTEAAVEELKLNQAQESGTNQAQDQAQG